MINKTASELLKETNAAFYEACKKVEQLETENKRLREAAEIEKPWPQKGDKCFIVDGSGETTKQSYHDGWGCYLKQGRLFRTEEEAIWARDWYANNAKKIHVLYELEQWAKEFNGDWVANWSDNNQAKNSLQYNFANKRIELATRWRKPINTLPVFKPNCIPELFAHFGDRLNVLFEVI